MFKHSLIIVCTIAIFASCQQSGDQKISSEDSEDRKISYMFGYRNGANIQGLDSIDWDESAIAQGFTDALAEKDPQLSQEVLQQMMMALQQKAQQQQQREQQERMAGADGNRQKGEEFLAENKTKAGVKTTDSGLQYKVIEPGTGESPEATDKVRVHYEGTLLDGEVFDSSYERGEPAEFPLNQVIPGWTEGVQLMKEGATYEFYIPGDLAYGAQGSRTIGPNETLIFKVELIEVLD